jgi:hypothetical protein
VPEQPEPARLLSPISYLLHPCEEGTPPELELLAGSHGPWIPPAYVIMCTTSFTLG